MKKSQTILPRFFLSFFLLRPRFTTIYKRVMDLLRLYNNFWLNRKFGGFYHSFLFFVNFFLFRFLQLMPYLGFGRFCRAQLSKKYLLKIVL